MLYGMSENGWTDQGLLNEFRFFMKEISPARHVIPFVDGHSTKYKPNTIKAAAEQGVVAFCLPPYGTHVTQPLNISFFSPLKVCWSETCHAFMQEIPSCVVTNYKFSTQAKQLKGWLNKIWDIPLQP